MRGRPLIELSLIKRTSKLLIYFTGLGSHATYIYIHASLYDFGQSLFNFLKRLLHEILAYFTWPAYPDSYCSSHSCLIFFKGNKTHFFLLLRNGYIYTLTCVFEVIMTFTPQF
jgi:hypothetical protein